VNFVDPTGLAWWNPVDCILDGIQAAAGAGLAAATIIGCGASAVCALVVGTAINAGVSIYRGCKDGWKTAECGLSVASGGLGAGSSAVSYAARLGRSAFYSKELISAYEGARTGLEVGSVAAWVTGPCSTRGAC
jgi:hypothetical protein